MAEIIKIDPMHPAAAFTRSKEVLSGGGVIVYPTDTLYGLGVDPGNARAVQRLFEIKGRRADQPILLLLHDAGQVGSWASEIIPRAQRLMSAYWPGPLTIVFRARREVPLLLTAGTGTIGLRVPGRELTRQLLGSLGSALTGTSANISGQGSAQTVREIVAAIGDRVDLVLDAGPAPESLPSTIVAATTGRIQVLRQGTLKIAG